MVVEIHSEISKYNADYRVWIRYGITNDAMLICIGKWWHDVYITRRFNRNQIRNQKIENIKELNKW